MMVTQMLETVALPHAPSKLAMIAQVHHLPAHPTAVTHLSLVEKVATMVIQMLAMDVQQLVQSKQVTIALALLQLVPLTVETL